MLPALLGSALIWSGLVWSILVWSGLVTEGGQHLKLFPECSVVMITDKDVHQDGERVQQQII